VKNRGWHVHLVAVLVVTLLTAAETARAESVKETYPLFGALLEVTVDSEDRETGQNRIRDAMAVAHRVEALVNADDPDSALARLNAKAGKGSLRVPLDLYRLLALSQLMTRSTGGAFDVTVGPLLRRRQAAASERGSRVNMAEALTLVGADKIVLTPPDGAELADEGMSVDFGAIAKGYALERMAATLRASGVVKALLEFRDSTVLAVGPPQGEAPFRIWIARGSSTIGSVALRDRSVSTVRAARRGEDSESPPIVDPRSGRFVDAERQATVVARDAAIAESWSTALVIDPDGALELLEEPRDVETLEFDEHGEHSSPRFAQFADWKAGGQGAARAEPAREEAPRPGDADKNHE
jgi:thiamine biosynthesis lipoprotein